MIAVFSFDLRSSKTIRVVRIDEVPYDPTTETAGNLTR